MDAIDGPNGVPMDTLPARSVSDHTLVSHSLGHREDRESGRAVNGRCGSGGGGEGVRVMNGHRLPSYVGISCAISGYSDYNRYSSSLRNSCTRRDISVALKNSTREPVNRLNDSLNRKNSLISEALITSRHNVSEDIENSGTDRSTDLTNNDISSDLNDKNSLLEQRIASLYGNTFAKDWRESRTRSRHKFDTPFSLAKQRSPSCPPIRKSTTNKTPTPLPMPVPTPPSIHKSSEHTNPVNNQIDHRIHTHSKTPKELPNCEIQTKEPVKQLEPQNYRSIEDNSQTAAKVTNNVSETQSAKPIESSDSLSEHEIQSPQTTPSCQRDGNWFLSELNKTTQQIQQNIDLTENLLKTDDSLMGEEFCGKLRAAIGKANLLINKKFQQFHELCLKNISQSNCEQFVTTNDDLQGFWDMMSIQVIDINDTFAQIYTLHASGWNKDFDVVLPKKMTSTPTKTVKSRKSTPKGSPVKACDETNTDRESERRNRLKEAKRKARLKASAADEEITIFIPSKNIQ
ncbi:unnamed protein product [Medioppia subpectinata]|uniref:Uncharacterized protein n=1 Tax=Medioppia subpectinata TaxID=1979941 RepID=A0A7R9Q0U0_9ACAR|nr:unnamed protein product [Medioppia subpectinata]CAG2108465.1 unnamed protein product [Medioppia subpectinata]